MAVPADNRSAYQTGPSNPITQRTPRVNWKSPLTSSQTARFNPSKVGCGGGGGGGFFSLFLRGQKNIKAKKGDAVGENWQGLINMVGYPN